jgi:A/G-specific adenine glycosylase
MEELDLSRKRKFFHHGLYAWSDEHPRDLPWKDEKDPYLIWLSEIILQQTRVVQGKSYYLRFKEHFPTVHHLAEASEQEVLKLWEGLGYYSRARNLHATARYVSETLGGRFPETYDGLLALKGVGPYTAAAIASFAYGLPHAVLDGNVFRVLARFLGLEEPIDSSKGKKRFARLAEEMLDKSQPGIYNQAIMDFGATACTPRKPACTTCPIKESCIAFQNKQVEDFPVKAKKLKRKTRYFNYLVLSHEDQLLIRKRTEKDIWQNLYDFLLWETARLVEKKKPDGSEWKELPLDVESMKYLRRSKPFRQTLSHQQIIAVFWEFEASTPLHLKEGSLQTVSRSSLKKYPFPKIVDWYLKDNSLNLELF